MGETSCITLREEQQIEVENRVLRRVFWSNREEVAGDWRKLPNEALYVLFTRYY